jgi:hypothetical protein
MSYTKPAYVYVMGDANGPMKVGASSRPRVRARTFIWEGRGYSMTIHATHHRPNDALTVERVALWMLREDREEGEWFRVSPEKACAAVEAAIKLVDSGNKAAVRQAKGRRRMVPERRTQDFAVAVKEFEEWAASNPEALEARLARMAAKP